MLLISRAEAAAIVNLARAPQVIGVQMPRGWEKVTIAPGQKWDTIGTATVRYGDTETRIDSTAEWAIWDDGTFGPQLDIKKIHGNIFR